MERDTLLAGQDGLFHRRVHVHHHAQAVGHGDRPAVTPAQELVDRFVHRLAHDVV